MISLPMKNLYTRLLFAFISVVAVSGILFTGSIAIADQPTSIYDVPIDKVPARLKFRVLELTPESRTYHRKQLEKLHLKGAGEVVTKRFYLSGEAPGEALSKGVAHYHLVRPLATVEDAEIRGYIDGRIVHHDINQGTANHMRIGRRFSGTEFGEFEIKRALVRWRLDNIPQKAAVKKARAQLFAESIATVSPIVRKGHYLPLHLYMYPLAPDWVEGRGGPSHDNYTGVAKGEVTWSHARHGEKPWTVPGALEPGVMPLAMGLYEKDASPVTFNGPLLQEYIQQKIRAGKNLDVLFKLDDEEEDRWGTEVGFYSSEFGDIKDIPDKRPLLDLDLEIPYPVLETRHSYSLKPGEEQVWPRQTHKGAKLLLAAGFDIEKESDPDAVYPDVWVRGGKGKFDPEAPWKRLSNPRTVDWDWSQFKLSGRPAESLFGSNVRFELSEYWVTARYLNLPFMMLLSPSGKLHEMRGQVPTGNTYTYVYSFLPDEPGLWRYIWFFLPTREIRLHTHENRGLFYVMPADEKT